MPAKEPRIFSENSWALIAKYYPIGLGILFAAGVIALYVWNNGFSTESQKLAEFGSYFGGVLTPIGIFVGWISYHKWQDAEQRTSNYLVASEALKSAKEMIEKINILILKISQRISQTGSISESASHASYLKRYIDLISNELMASETKAQVHRHHKVLLDNEKEKIALLTNETGNSLLEIYKIIYDKEATHETTEEKQLTLKLLDEMEFQLSQSTINFINSENQ